MALYTIKLTFNFNGDQVKLEFNKNEYMKDIIKKYALKIDKDTKDCFFLYNGDIINEELQLKDIYNSINDDEMKILVDEFRESNNEDNSKLSKFIICPQCKENCIILFKNYKINI